MLPHVMLTYRGGYVLNDELLLVQIIEDCVSFTSFVHKWKSSFCLTYMTSSVFQSFWGNMASLLKMTQLQYTPNISCISKTHRYTLSFTGNNLFGRSMSLKRVLEMQTRTIFVILFLCWFVSLPHSRSCKISWLLNSSVKTIYYYHFGFLRDSHFPSGHSFPCMYTYTCCSHATCE